MPPASSARRCHATRRVAAPPAMPVLVIVAAQARCAWRGRSGRRCRPALICSRRRQTLPRQRQHRAAQRARAGRGARPGAGSVGSAARCLRARDVPPALRRARRKSRARRAAVAPRSGDPASPPAPAHRAAPTARDCDVRNSRSTSAAPGPSEAVANARVARTRRSALRPWCTPACTSPASASRAPRDRTVQFGVGVACAALSPGRGEAGLRAGLGRRLVDRACRTHLSRLLVANPIVRSPPCPNCPKSKPPAAAWRRTSKDGASPAWCCVARTCAGRSRRRSRDLLPGQRIDAVRRRAKYLLLDTDAGSALLHLGMSGSLRVLPADTPVRRARPCRHRAGRLGRAGPRAALQRSAPLRLPAVAAGRAKPTNCCTAWARSRCRTTSTATTCSRAAAAARRR